MKRSFKVFFAAVIALILISCNLIPAFATGYVNEDLIDDVLENYSMVDEQLREEGFFDDYTYYNQFASDTLTTTSPAETQTYDYEDYYNSVYESQLSDLREQYESNYAEFEEHKAEIDSQIAENESRFNEAESHIDEQHEKVEDYNSVIAPVIGTAFAGGALMWVLMFVAIIVLFIVSIVGGIIEIVYIYRNAPKCDMTKLWALVPLISPLFGLFAVIYVRSTCKKMETATTGVTGKITCPTCNGVHPNGTTVCTICGTELNKGE